MNTSETSTNIFKWDIGWGPISACNMKCLFCYSKKRREVKKDDLCLRDWIGFIDDNNQYINSINYGTGENTLSKDWFSLIEHIRNNYPHIKQALTTNGHLSQAIKDEHLLNIFIKAIDEVDVSLDFCDKIKHNKFRGQPNAYEWALETMKLCNQFNKRLTIVFLGSAYNTSLENIDGLFAIAAKNNSILRMNLFRPMDISNPELSRFILGYDEIVNILQHINSKYQILSLSDPFFSAIFSGPEKADPSGVKSLRILANGDISPSTYLINDSYIVGNITQKNVLQWLQSRTQLQEMTRAPLPESCHNCILASKCHGGVVDRRYLWFGDLSHRDPYCVSPILSSKQLPSPLVFSKSKVASVHDDYLPTMFFSPQARKF